MRRELDDRELFKPVPGLLRFRPTYRDLVQPEGAASIGDRYEGRVIVRAYAWAETVEAATRLMLENVESYGKLLAVQNS